MENKPDRVTRIVGFLSAWNRLSRSMESVLIDLIAATAPWLAPIIPAYMVHVGLKTALGMPTWIAWSGAIIVEFLGLSAVSTTLTLWDYNDRKKEAVTEPATRGNKRKPRRRKVKGLAPVWVALGAGVFYLAVVLVVNVLLDKSDWVARLAKGLLSSLSVIAALILAIRAQHARRLEVAEQRKQAMRVAREATKKITAKPEEEPAQLEPVAEQPKEPVIEFTGNKLKVYQIAKGNPNATHAQIGKQVNVSRQLVGRYIGEFEDAGLIHKNGIVKEGKE